MENETDFCDRIPGCHTGRLSLELQASEAAEWQEIVDMLATRVRNLEAAVNKLKASPAAGESPGISPEPAQAHGLTPPATPSAAVGASGPGAGDHKEWCDGAKETYERQVESDTVPRAEYDRVVKLNHHLREAAVMAIVERVPSDSKPTNCHNPESEDTPPHNPVLGPVVGTAAFQWHYDPSVPTVSPEVGKRYVCRNGEVTETMGAGLRIQTYPFRASVNGVTRTWMRDGKHDESKSSEYDLIAEYHEPEPPPPAESPDDWVTLTDPDHVARKCDECRCDRIKYDWNPCQGLIGVRIGDVPAWGFRCRRKDLPVVPHHVACSGDRSKPVGSPGCSCPTLDGVPVTGSACPEHGLETGDLNSLPSPWRPMTEDYPRDTLLWVARDDGLVYTERNPDAWPLAKAIAWMLAVTPLHPNATPPDKQNTRTVRGECDHKWDVVDDSFDHEFGCEQIVFQRCELCGQSREYNPPVFDDDVM